MRVYLETLGCRLNFAEMAELGRQLTGAGHDVVASAAEADVCVLNSCAVTGEAARKSRQLARQLARADPEVPVIMTGCLATLEPQVVSALPNVRLVVGNERKDQLLRLIARLPARGGAGRDAPLRRPPRPGAGGQLPAHGALFDRTRAFVKVQDGCHNRCTFCIVSAARGVERSVAAGAVVAEVNALHQAGYQEAVLTGVHLGAYGRDGRGDLRSLLDALLAETAIPRLRLSSLEPFDLAAEFFDRWQTSDGRLMPHLHLPAQAGSDATLRRMARRNSVADFESLVAAARDRIPGLTLTTDLIAGFPGESEADFAETLAFARRVAFAHVHVFAYSARAGTAAARMKDQVPQPERRRRSRVLNELGRELGDTVRTGALGQVRPVLWEHADTSLEAELVTWSGLTDNYLRVRTAVPASRVLHNRILPTRLERLDGQDLWGELIEPHHPPAGTSPHPPF